ncbi:hypothetical protein [Paenibacillus silviterrae]|uniref:hypothetical protein n=1 Tax=Paenibacillus silviterrae TaxID=3242194 RepID=UPI0025438460|nr:hypothetical protein [Paenibacillus chinjuensis]
MQWTKRKVSFWFPVLAMLVIFADVFALREAKHHPEGDWMQLAVALDWVVVLPFLFYLLIVRSNRHSWKKVLAVIALGCLASHSFLNLERWPLLRSLGQGVFVLELAFITFELYLVYTVIRRFLAVSRKVISPLDKLKCALLDKGKPNVLKSMMIHDLSMVYYAFFSWRAVPYEPREAQAFTVHRKSNSVLWTMLLLKLSLLEGFGVHLLLMQYSEWAAWIATLLHAPVIVWLVASCRALRLQPVLLLTDRLILRHGLSLDAEVPIASIETVETARELEVPKELKNCSAVTALDQPNLRLRLSEQVQVRTLLGLYRKVTIIDAAIDEPELLTMELKKRMTQ